MNKGPQPKDKVSPPKHERRRRSSRAEGRIEHRRANNDSPKKEKKRQGDNITLQRSLAQGYSLEDRTKHRKEPHLFREARKLQWAHVVLRCTTHPEEAAFVRKSDGMTALLLAVISRASYSNCLTASSDFDGPGVPDIWFKCDDNPAPLDAIRALLKAYPTAVYQQCSKMGYTPLAYASLVPPIPPSGDDEDTAKAAPNEEKGIASNNAIRDPYNLDSWQGAIFDQIILGENHKPPKDMFDEAETLVGLLLDGHPESASIKSHSGLSAVDIHVISFSQARGAEGPSTNYSNSAGQIGKTTTSVLRVLLESDPSLARSQFSSLTRLPEAAAAGPLEYLYRWNAAAIIEAVERQRRHTPSKQNVEFRRNSISTPSRQSQTSPAYASSASRASSARALSISARTGMTVGVASWWIWQWTIILLKYGVMHVKKRGVPFSALHAAAYTEGCPLPLLLLIMRTFPAQLKKRDQMVVNNAMLPLSIVCTWGQNRRPDAITASRKSMAIGVLLAEYPEGVEIVDDHGRHALSHAIESGTTWNGGVRKLIEENPEILRQNDPKTQLYPFLLAATTTTTDTVSQVWTVFELLRADPKVLEDCFSTGSFDSEESQAWANFDDWAS